MAASNDPNLNLALRVTADLNAARDQVKQLNQSIDATGTTAKTATTALDQASQKIDDVVASSREAAQATASIAAGMAAAVEGIKAMGESEEEATARIRAVIAASRDQQAAELAAANARARSSAVTQQSTAEAQALAAAIQRQTVQMQQASAVAAQMAASESRAAGSAQDQAAAVAQLLGQIDPAVAALERLDQQEQQLAKFRSQGLIDDETFARFNGQIEKSRAALGRMGVSAGQTAQAVRQLPVQMSQAFSGLLTGQSPFMVLVQQGHQVVDSFGSIGAAIEGIGSVVTVTSVGLTGLAAAVAAVLYGLNAGQKEDEAFNAALDATNGYLGVTLGQLRGMQTALATGDTSLGDANKALLAVANSGRFSGQAIQQVAQAAIDMSKVTGTSIDAAVQQFVRLQDDPVQAAQALDRQYHFLTEDIYDQIAAAQESGDKAQAAALLQKDLADNFAAAAKAQEEQMGSLQRGWAEVLHVITSVKNALLDIGRTQTPAEQLAAVTAQLKKYAQQGLVAPTASGGFALTAKATQQPAPTSLYDASLFAPTQDGLQQLIASYTKLRAAVAAADKQAADTSADKKRTEAEIEANQQIQAMLDSLDKASRKADAIKKLNQLFTQAWENNTSGNNPLLTDVIARTNKDGSLSFSGGDYDKLLADINKRYAEPASKTDYSGAIAAQQDLIKTLQDLQGALSPTAAAWAKYDQAVAKATEDATKAKTAPGANAAAIDAEANAVKAAAKTALDADLAKIAQQDSDAWDKLLGRLGTPVEVNIDKAVQQLQQLNKLMAQGNHSASDYQQGLSQILSGNGNLLGNIQVPRDRSGSALGRDLQQQAQITKQQQLLSTNAQQAIAKATQDFQSGQIQSEKDYQTLLYNIRKEAADKSVQLDQSRRDLQLQTASDLFGELVVLERSGNADIAAVGKAAAIAQAMVQTYLAASKALASAPNPALGAVEAAVAVAAGLANVAAIESQSTSFATGGEIHGPGTKTSDSIPIWASAGEFMQRAAAVDYYGVDFMHAVNNLQFPKMAFAEGGLIAPAPVMAPTSPKVPSLSSVGAGIAQSSLRARFVLVDDPQRLPDALQGPVGEQAFVVHLNKYMPSIVQSVRSS